MPDTHSAPTSAPLSAEFADALYQRGLQSMRQADYEQAIADYQAVLSLVQQPEPVIRSPLEHCRLPWEEQCLSFHRTERTVATASALQVRRPIYDNAINSWKAVATELAPLRASLAENSE